MAMRKEERDYRSLERERMYRIFSPLDESEPPQPSDESRVIISGRGAWMIARKPHKRRP
jgi:hypothetical protein